MVRTLINILVVVFLLATVSCSKSKNDIDAETARHLKTAQMYADQGQIKAAIFEVKKAIQLDAKNTQGYVQLAKIFNGIGAYSTTQTLLEGVIKDMPGVSIELANAYTGNKKFQSAIDMLKAHPVNALDDKNYSRWLIALATANAYLGNDAEYKDAATKLAATKGDPLERQMLEVNYLITHRQLDEADAILEKLVQTNPDNTNALILRGQIALVKQDYPSAEQSLTKALSLAPDTDIMSADRIKIFTLLTEVLVRQGRTSEAMVYQKKLAEANPEGNAAQQLFNDALAHYQKGNFSEAEKILVELRKQFPDDTNTATLLGMVEFQKGDTDKAASLFNEFIDTETSAPSVLQVAALVKFKNNEIDDAIKLLKDAAEKQPKNATILATYGMALLGRDEKSEPGALALEKSLALNPANQRIRLALAKRHMVLGEKDQALSQYRKAYQEQPTDLVIQQAYFKALIADNQASKVKEEIAAFKSKFSEHPRGDFIEAWFLMQNKNYSGAEAAFKRVIAAKDAPDKYLSLIGIAELGELQNDIPKAINSWQQAITSDPSVTAAYGHWIKLMLANNKRDAAISFLTSIENSQAELWQPSVVLAQVYANQKQWAEASTTIETALKRSSNAANVTKIAADIYQMQGQDAVARNKLDEARTSYSKSVNLMPGQPEYLVKIIEVEIASHNYVEAQKLLDSFPQTESNANVRYFLQGVIKANEGKADEAIKFYLKSWAAKPVETVAASIADYYGKNNMTDALNEFYEDWVVKLPNSARGATLKAMKEQHLNHNELAVQWYEKAISISPNSLIALNNLAWLYYLQNDGRAIETAKKAYDIAPNSASVVDTYGWILVERGDAKAGLEILNQAVALEPNNKEIQDHVKTAKQRVK
ncbi:MAG: tetratricopeptide repeat protein [Gammaproteobacteria bacterium]|nr:MAG: tetratricopeptide repeat protein [Gammaproteobacteria bacterium]